MAKYECLICGYVYDEEAEGVKFEDLPEDYICPDCGAPKEDFEKID
ncbi:MAG: rubredoxin [Candidatus Hodarchaeales archaeon]|jgi:rubredoxin